MNIDQLVARFPEIPPAVRGDARLARYAEVFDRWLRVAREPSPCALERDAANHCYLKLVSPLAVLKWGLSTPERALVDVEALIARYQDDPAAFEAWLIPEGTVDREVRGPGCG